MDERQDQGVAATGPPESISRPRRRLPLPAGALVTGLVAGALLSLSIPPVGWWVLAPVGLAAVAGRLRGQRVSTRLVTGFFAGIGLFGPTLYWATAFNAAGWVALVIVESAILACACALVPPRRGLVLAFPGAIVLAEAVRTHWPFGGLPLGGIWLGQASGPLRDAARIGGPLLLTGLIALVAVALLELARALQAAAHHQRGDPVKSVAAAAAALVVVAATGGWGAAAADGGPAVSHLRGAVVQGGGARGFRKSQVDPAVVFAAQLDASRSLGPPLDLVLWPENVIALDGPLRGSPEEAAVGDLARSLRTTVVAGVTEPVGARLFRNRVVAWGPEGDVVASVEKVHRVPFGEYVPGRAFFSHLADLSAVPRDAISGTGPGAMTTPAGRVAVLISYEVFFPSRGRSGVGAGGQVLLVPTNTSSYSTGQVPSQELAAARLQAIEGGRDLLQAAPTGFSAVIDNSGRVVARTSLGTRQVLTATVARRSGRTLYVRGGDGPVMAAALCAVVLGWLAAGSVALAGDTRLVEGGHLGKHLRRRLENR